MNPNYTIIVVKGEFAYITVETDCLLCIGKAEELEGADANEIDEMIKSAMTLKETEMILH